MGNDGFSKTDLARPPSRQELARIDNEWKALEIWRDTGDLRKVRDGIKSCRNLRQAQVLVNRGVERWDDERREWNRAAYVRQAMILKDLITKVGDKIDEGDMARVADLMRVFDRQSKLHDLDEARKDQPQTGIQIVVNTGIPELPALPNPAAPDVIDGEVVE